MYLNESRAEDIAVILNITADVADGARADATLLLRAFANEAANSFALEYSSYYGHHDRDDIVYVRIGTRTGRHDASNRKCVCIGRFASMEEGRQASVVRWNTGIANCARTGLVACLEGISRRRAAKRKRESADVRGIDGHGPLIRPDDPRLLEMAAQT